MICPTEYICALFVDGELPENEAREVARHVETCQACDRLVAELRGESRMLVQCLQDVDLEVSHVPEFSSAGQPLGVVKFALGVIGAAVAFRISTGILFGLQLPAQIGWLDPREWASSLLVALNAVEYAVDSAGSVVSGTVQTAVLATVGVAVLWGMSRVLSRSAATGSIFAVLIAMGVFSSPSYAIDLRKGGSVPAGETVDDSVVAVPDKGRANIDIAGNVKGDLFAVGDVVTVSGAVDGNVVAFARRVEISGTVGGSLAGAAQTVVISGRVSKNAIAAGGVVNFLKSAEIEGNSIVGTGEAVIEGKTRRDLIFGGGMLDLRGDIGRNVTFGGGQVSLSDSAHIGGDLRAQVDKEENVRVANGAVIGGKKNVKVNQRVPGPSRYLTVRFYVWQVVRLLAAFITGLILFRLIPSLAPLRLTSGMDWLKAGGLGFIALVSVPIACLIVGITVIGLPIALLSFALWLAGLYFSKIIVAEFVGRTLMKSSGAVPLLAGLVLVIVAVDLPWVGTLINWLLMLLGLGAMALTIYKNTFRAPAAAEL
jgi:hypothetical protein